MTRPWPWLLVLAVAALASTPLVRSGDRLFLARVDTDAAATLWFYDLVVREGHEVETLDDFGWPSPLPRAREFPSTADAALAAPLGRLLDLPGRWGWTQALAVLVNALGAALLARGFGARGWGIVLAGLLGAVGRSTWAMLDNGRMNAAWPGLAAGAAGAWLALADTRRRPTFAALATGLGVAAALVYPPYLVLLAPAALVFFRPAPDRWGWVWLAAPVAMAGAMVFPDLTLQLGTRAGQPCPPLACPDATRSLDLQRLFVWQATGWPGLGQGGTWAAPWLLAPLALRAPRRHAVAAALLVMAALAALALGPCAGGAPSSATWLWCPLQRLTDYGRAATTAAFVAAALGGLAVVQLGRRTGTAAGLLVATLTVSAWWSEVRHSGYSSTWPASPAAAFLRTAAPGPVVELPYDRSGMFVSVIEAPGRPRVNPLKPGGDRTRQDATLRWFDALGRGELPATDPSPARVQASGVRWVLFDPARCQHPYVPAAACGEAARATLERVLGPPQDRGDLLVWDLGARDD